MAAAGLPGAACACFGDSGRRAGGSGPYVYAGGSGRRECGAGWSRRVDDGSWRRVGSAGRYACYQCAGGSARTPAPAHGEDSARIWARPKGAVGACARPPNSRQRPPTLRLHRATSWWAAPRDSLWSAAVERGCGEGWVLRLHWCGAVGRREALRAPHGGQRWACTHRCVHVAMHVAISVVAPVVALAIATMATAANIWRAPEAIPATLSFLPRACMTLTVVTAVMPITSLLVSRVAALPAVAV